MLIIANIIINYYVNPHSKYSHRFFRPLASTSHKDKYFLLQKKKKPIDVVVFGSSRSMTLNPNYISNKVELSAFNVAVNGARSEDIFEISKFIINEKKLEPKLFIIGMDIMAFQNISSINNGLKVFNPLYINEKNKFIKIWENFTYLLSIRHTIDSFKVIIFEFIIGWPDKKNYYDHNGFLVYKEKNKNDNLTRIELQETIDFYINNVFSQFESLDSNRLTNLENLLKICSENNIYLKFFLTPFHPAVKKVLDDHGVYQKRKNELISYLKNKKNKFSFDFYDLSNINSFSGSETDFYDGEHIKEKNSEKILDFILIEPNNYEFP